MKNLWISLAVTVATVVSGSLAEAQLPLPLGPEFRPDPETESRHRIGTVATRPGGDFVIVWNRDDVKVVARLYDSAGAPVSEVFETNDVDPGLRVIPDVAMANDGAFVVVWSNRGLDPDAISGQRFASDGGRLGEEFRVGLVAPTSYRQVSPSIAMRGDGSFWVTWAELDLESTFVHGFTIHGQRFSSDGLHLGEQFVVDSYPGASQRNPDIGFSSSGDAVVVWQRRFSPEDFRIEARQFASDGVALGPAFDVQSYTTGYLEYPRVAVAPGGGFLVVWQSPASFGSDDDPLSIQGQFFEKNGEKKGGQFQVNSATFGTQQDPAVGVAADGRFVVVWESLDTYGGELVRRIKGQRYLGGRALGVEFDVGEIAPLRERQPNVAVSPEGTFVVAWRSLDLYAGGNLVTYAIRARRFSIDDELLFGDGFEGGGLLAWSHVVP